MVADTVRLGVPVAKDAEGGAGCCVGEVDRRIYRYDVFPRSVLLSEIPGRTIEEDLTMPRATILRNSVLYAAAMATMFLLGAPAIPAEAQSALPFVSKHIYSETADAKADIASAQAKARKEHKRLILAFGGDWCGDCQVLDIYLHQSPNAELLNKHFVLVHIDVGHLDKNVDVAEKYGIPLKKGVPALTVVSPLGKTLYSQQTGEFEKMQSMDSKSVTEFLNKWKA